MFRAKKLNRIRCEHSEQGLGGQILHFEPICYQIGQGDRLPLDAVYYLLKPFSLKWFVNTAYFWCRHDPILHVHFLWLPSTRFEICQ